MATASRPRPFRSLASRMVALGVLQFALFIGTAIAFFIAEGPREEPRPRDHIVPAVVQRLEGLVAEPGALQAALEDLERKHIEVSLYDAQRQLVATNVDPPLAIPERRRFRHSATPDPASPGSASPGSASHDPAAAAAARRRSMVMAFHVHGERGYLVARGVHRAPSIAGPLLTVICGLVILVLGALFTARWIVRPIERLSRTARALGSGDLTARSRLERSDEIGELGRRIDEMADRIEGLLVSEKELLANVAHELRTPLTRIGVALDLASEGDAGAARASLAEIAVDVSELETIVDDILMAMRFEVAGAAELPLRRAVIAPAEIARAAEDRLRGRHPGRPLEVAVAEALPPIHVDPRLFRRVIDNLLENAHKYSPDPDARLDLTVTADTAGGGVAFELRDRGIGITADDLPRVFAPFFRGDRSRSREAGGVGLGLTLAKRIVTAHGGTIELSSTPGTGTTVRVTVPAAA
ncbi:MAG TPA: HAMP domain-containing sensor histidine kinase [Kofleriaceae bacterium]|nr:HAMP domain-containing sensor histidine kinase [Kofleriaceae bacterium]